MICVSNVGYLTGFLNSSGIHLESSRIITLTLLIVVASLVEPVGGALVVSSTERRLTETQTGYNRDPIRTTKNGRGAFSFNPKSQPLTPFSTPLFYEIALFGLYQAKFLTNKVVKRYRYSPLCPYWSEC